jgi:uncharacterized OB-fold protein
VSGPHRYAGDFTVAPRQGDPADATPQGAVTNPALFYGAGDIEGGPGLKGSRCTACGTVVLQAVPVCPRCHGRVLQPACIGRRATLGLSSLVHHSADGFAAPYVIAEIRTEEGPRTFAPILAPVDAPLPPGMPLRFELVARSDGRVGFAYAPER